MRLNFYFSNISYLLSSNLIFKNSSQLKTALSYYCRTLQFIMEISTSYRSTMPAQFHASKNYEQLLQYLKSSISSRFFNGKHDEEQVDDIIKELRQNSAQVQRISRNVSDDLKNLNLIDYSMYLQEITSTHSLFLQLVSQKLKQTNQRYNIAKSKQAHNPPQNDVCQLCNKQMKEVRIQQIYNSLSTTKHLQTYTQIQKQEEQFKLKQIDQFDVLMSDIQQNKKRLLNLNNDKTIYNLQRSLSQSNYTTHQSYDKGIGQKMNDNRDMVDKLFKQFINKFMDVSKNDIKPTVIKCAEDLAQYLFTKKKNALQFADMEAQTTSGHDEIKKHLRQFKTLKSSNQKIQKEEDQLRQSRSRLDIGTKKSIKIDHQFSKNLKVPSVKVLDKSDLSCSQISQSQIGKNRQSTIRLLREDPDIKIKIEPIKIDNVLKFSLVRSQNKKIIPLQKIQKRNNLIKSYNQFDEIQTQFKNQYTFKINEDREEKPKNVLKETVECEIQVSRVTQCTGVQTNFTSQIQSTKGKLDSKALKNHNNKTSKKANYNSLKRQSMDEKSQSQSQSQNGNKSAIKDELIGIISSMNSKKLKEMFSSFMLSENKKKEIENKKQIGDKARSNNQHNKSNLKSLAEGKSEYSKKGKSNLKQPPQKLSAQKFTESKESYLLTSVTNIESSRLRPKMMSESLNPTTAKGQLRRQNIGRKKTYTSNYKISTEKKGEEIDAKIESLKRRQYQDFFKKEDLVTLFGSLEAAYQYQSHLNTKSKLTTKDRARYEEIILKIYEQIQQLKNKNILLYNRIKAFVKFPYQSVINQFDGPLISSSMGYNQFYCFLANIMTKHQECERSSSNICCFHIQRLLQKIKLSGCSQKPRVNLPKLQQ